MDVPAQCDARGGRRARDGQPAFHDRSRSSPRPSRQHIAQALSPRSIQRTPRSIRRTTRNLKRRLTPSSRNGARRCSRSTGQHVVAYHDSWPYFAHRFGFNIDIFLEPKPGIPPSPSHLAEVIEQMKAGHIKAIIVEPYHNRKIAEKVAASTGAKVVDFAQFPGALPNTDTYVELIDTLVVNDSPRR